jgi:hypothetical protein
VLLQQWCVGSHRSEGVCAGPLITVSLHAIMYSCSVLPCSCPPHSSSSSSSSKTCGHPAAPAGAALLPPVVFMRYCACCLSGVLRAGRSNKSILACMLSQC